MEMLMKLSSAFGVPGHEEEVASLMKNEFAKHTRDVKIDGMGDVIAKFEGKGPTVMLGAHMDEIGMLVKLINDQGFIRFIKVGGIDDRILLNQRVVIKTQKGKIYGVIGNKPPHLQKEEEMKKIIEKKQLFVDIGAKDRKDAERMGVRIGDPIAFDVEPKEMNNLITGKALDDRIGCAILLEIAKKVRGRKLVLVGTVQEEVSQYGKGAMISAYTESPDYFVAVDTCIACDHPECVEGDGSVKMNQGPAIGLVEWGGRGNVASKKLVDWLEETAKKNKLPYQLEVSEGGATDAAHVYSVKEGIPSVAIGVPTRYIHSNVGVVSKEDIENTVKLLVKALEHGP